MAAREIRVTVGLDHGPGSGIWKIWSHGDDTYLTERSIRPEAHASRRPGRRTKPAARSDVEHSGEWPAPAAVIYRPRPMSN